MLWYPRTGIRSHILLHQMDQDIEDGVMKVFHIQTSKIFLRL